LLVELMGESLTHKVLSQGDIEGGSDEDPLSQARGPGEQAADVPFQKEATENCGKGSQSEEERGSEEDADKALTCFLCHKAGLGADCQGVFRKREIILKPDLSNDRVRCSRWGPRKYLEFEAISLP